VSTPALVQTTTQTYTGVLVLHWCWSCSIPYGLDQDFNRRNREEGRTWYCPRGHATVFGNSKLELAREETERERRRRKQADARATAWQDQAQAAERSARATRGHLTRLRRRIANGVCPWCKRSFKNVADHVKGQHPEHLEELKAVQA
jgi:hypothetical protein